MDEMLTIAPERFGSILRTATHVPYIGPCCRTRRPRSMCSASISCAPPTQSIPALFTQYARAPCSSATSAACSCTDHSPMSPTTGRYSPPNSPATSSSPSASTSTAATRNPSATSRRAIARPIPIAAPVTTADFICWHRLGIPGQVGLRPPSLGISERALPPSLEDGWFSSCLSAARAGARGDSRIGASHRAPSKPTAATGSAVERVRRRARTRGRLPNEVASRRRGPETKLDWHADFPLPRPFAAQRVNQDLRRQLAHGIRRDPRGRERRLEELREVEIVEARHSDVVRDTKALLLHGLYHARGEEVTRCHDRRGWIPQSEELPDHLAAESGFDLSLEHLEFGSRGDSCLDQRTAVTGVSLLDDRPRHACCDKTDPRVTVLDQVGCEG